MRIVAVADVHLGKQPSKAPDALGHAADLSVAQAWRNLVAYCAEDPPSALLIAGDLVDDDDDLFEATATVSKGVAHLAALGTRVIAVSGNHDQKALQRVAAEVKQLEVLGHGGRWESATLEVDRERLRVLGWSFPHARHHETPVDDRLRSLAAEPFDGPTIGLLHGDLDATQSPYAPVRRRDLEALPTAAWLLGHQHVTHDLDRQEKPVGYLGSLAASDPGEFGRHGAWEVTLQAGQITFKHVPLAPLRYERLSVELPHETTPNTSVTHIQEGIRAALSGTVTEANWLQGIALRLDVTGRLPQAGTVLTELREQNLDNLYMSVGSVTVAVEQHALRLLPPLDLERIAGDNDPLGSAAELLLTLRGERGEAAQQAAIERLTERLPERHVDRHFRPLDLKPNPDERLQGLIHATERVIQGLLAQREDGA